MSKSPPMSDRPICVARVQGGLGNQLFCYAHGRRVAALLDRELVLDVSELTAGDLYWRRFELPKLGVVCRTFSSRWLAHPWGRVTRRLIRPVVARRVYREPRTPDPAAEVLPRWIYLDGYWQHDAGINDQREDLVREIAVPPAMLSPAATNLARRLGMDGAIGIHLRSYAEEKVAERRQVPTPSYFLAAIDCLISEFGRRPIFVATDDSSKLLQAAPAHVKKLLVERPSALTQFEDFQLLRACALHVLCNSSFGWWPAFLSSSARVYYPANAGFFHYPSPARGWSVIPDPGATASSIAADAEGVVPRR
jgi:hypothetical protein